MTKILQRGVVYIPTFALDYPHQTCSFTTLQHKYALTRHKIYQVFTLINLDLPSLLIKEKKRKKKYNDYARSHNLTLIGVDNIENFYFLTRSQ